MRSSAPMLASLTAIAAVVAMAGDESVDYGGIAGTLDPWEKTQATGMADIDIARSGRIWLAGSNGTIWSSKDGTDFEQESGVSGFGRIAAGEEGQQVGAVGRDNHTLWIKGPGGERWYQTKASGVADFAFDGYTVWIAGTNGTIWYAPGPAANRGQIESLEFKQVKAEGFCRVATHTRRLWAVGCNGTLWEYKRNYKTDSAWDAGEWVQTPASGIADVAADESDTLWLTGKNGSVWKSIDGKNFEQISPPGAGFVSIGAAKSKVYAVRKDGTLWRFKS